MKEIVVISGKGGTGKTSLLFQSATIYAEQHAHERVLVLDLCPQANLSELFLGGLMGGGSDALARIQEETPRRTVGGYFELRFPSPYAVPTIPSADFFSIPSQHNNAIPTNITLLAGDPLLELQSNAIATLANTQIPGQDTWLAVVDWISDFINAVAEDFDIVFIDTNPSFSVVVALMEISSSSICIL